MEPVPRELIEHMDDGLLFRSKLWQQMRRWPFCNSDELFRRIGGIDAPRRRGRGKEAMPAADRSWRCDNHVSTLNETIAR